MQMQIRGGFKSDLNAIWQEENRAVDEFPLNPELFLRLGRLKEIFEQANFCKVEENTLGIPRQPLRGEVRNKEEWRLELRDFQTPAVNH